MSCCADKTFHEAIFVENPGDTNAGTVKLLKENHYFGMDEDQITLFGFENNGEKNVKCKHLHTLMYQNHVLSVTSLLFSMMANRPKSGNFW